MPETSLRLSLIIPVYNGELDLPEFLDSLRRQKVFPDEVIFVNDGSSDKTLAILESFAADYPHYVRIISQPNAGAGRARNHALQEARGIVVGFADADDILAPSCIEAIKAAWIEDMSLDVMAINGQEFWSDGLVGKLLIYDVQAPAQTDGQTWVCDRLRAGNFEHYSPLYFVRMDVVRHLGVKFSEGMGHEDVLWLTPLLLGTQKMRFINEVLYFYRQRKERADNVPLRSRIADLQSAIINTLGTAKLALSLSLRPQTFEALRREFVNGGASKSHEFKLITDRAARRMLARQMISGEFFVVIWGQARGFKERFRVAKAWLRTRYALR